MTPELPPEFSVTPGSVHTLTPHDLAVTGGSIARLSGLAVFLDKGLPGETLRCRITESKPRFAKAEVLETLVPSPHAVPSFCAFSGRCGGCAWPDLDYAAQLAWKERHVMETLRRIGNVACGVDGGPEYLPITPSPRITGYRNKMEFAFGFEAGQPALGLRQKNSHEIVSVPDCPLSAFPVKTVLALAGQWMREHGLQPFGGGKGFPRFLVVRCPAYTPDGTPRCLVECITAPGNRHEGQLVKKLGERLMRDAGVTGFIHSSRSAGSNVAYGEKIILSLGETTVTEEFGGARLEAPVQSFMQANTAAATRLYGYIREYAASVNARIIWDLYCGVGAIALCLSGGETVVRGMEAVIQAVAYARKNAEAVSGDIAFAAGDVNSGLEKLTPLPDLVVTDPPRSGMTRNLAASLLRLRPRHIITVSCDVGSLARDIKALSESYGVRSIRAVDLFPHTPHVETVALLALSKQ